MALYSTICLCTHYSTSGTISCCIYMYANLAALHEPTKALAHLKKHDICENIFTDSMTHLQILQYTSVTPSSRRQCVTEPHYTSTHGDGTHLGPSCLRAGQGGSSAIHSPHESWSPQAGGMDSLPECRAAHIKGVRPLEGKFVIFSTCSCVLCNAPHCTAHDAYLQLLLEARTRDMKKLFEW